MASSPGHRPTRSMTTANLQSPAATSPGARPRRLTSPSQGSLAIPENGQQQFVRPPSPLRNEFIPDTSTGIDPNESDDDDDDDNPARWGERSPSPTSSVSQLAATLAQKVGSFVEGIKSRTHLPTDAELEAEAQRERDRSRREAEAILTKEAEQRRLMEGRVLSMMDNTKSLPPPPSRPAVSNPPSPSGSHKEKDGLSWWTAAKNRLTPTKDKDKEPLTPAQQVIQEAKAREKEQKKITKGKEKEKEKGSDWSGNPPSKYGDPSMSNLNIPPSPQRRALTGSPVSPTPSRPNLSNMPPNLTPSPMRSVDGLSVSPSREAPPLYAQFNAEGILDVHGTLLVIAKRFEKLEKWTVGHVRALEERMNDVERWLVDKEKEKGQKEDGKEQQSPYSINPGLQQEVNDIREEIGELQGRVGELGREMAKMVTAPAHLSSGPSRQSPLISSTSPTNSFMATHESPFGSLTNTPHHSRLVSVTARESTSPPMASANKSSGTRLPYPTGDYASPSDSFSPPSSPPNHKARSMSISGLPNASSNNTGLGTNLGVSSSASTSYSNLSFSSTSSIGLNNNNNTNNAPRAVSPSSSITNLPKPQSPSVHNVGGTSPNLAIPQQQEQGRQQRRQSSISPTPRKRYTVALGEPLRSQSPPAVEEAMPRGGGGGGGGGGNNGGGSGTPIAFHKPRTSIGSTMFSADLESGGNMNEDEDEFVDETIGKSKALRMASSGSGSGFPGSGINNDREGSRDKEDIFSSSSTTMAIGKGDSKDTASGLSRARPTRRPRPQSTYTFGSGSMTAMNASLEHTPTPQASIQPLRPKSRSQSIDLYNRFGSRESLTSVSSASSTASASVPGKFVDPLLLRKQGKEKEKEKERDKVATPRPKGKVAVGQLVAFFDGEKRS